MLFRSHLNLTEFRPLSGAHGLAPLLQAEGGFNPEAVSRVRPTPALLRAVIEEWSEQVGRFRKAGALPTHIDSHHNVHTIPWIFPVLKTIQRRFDIRRVRLSKNVYGPEHRVSWRLLQKKRLWNAALRHCVKTTTTDGFTSLGEFASLLRSGALSRWTQQRRSIEVMTHPGIDLFAEETRLLESDFLRAQPFELSSYATL